MVKILQSPRLRSVRGRRWVILPILLALFFGALLWLKNPFTRPKSDPNLTWVPVSSTAPLVHISSRDSFAATQEGIQAAKSLLTLLETKDLKNAKAANTIYDRIIPRENYGGEYTALQWFCRYLLASAPQQQKMIADPTVSAFFNFFAADDFSRLKEYLKRKYKLADLPDQESREGQDRKALLEDTILFNNPRREEWEKTSKTIEVLNLKPGTAIADVGSGPGYYSFQFSKLVGPKGKVFAIDTINEHLDYIKRVKQKNQLNNIQPVITDGNTIGVPANQVDLVFLCSLYHNIYATAKDIDIDQFLNSIKTALKENGTLVVADNALVPKGQLPYHGPYIAKELLIGQFKYYGFRLIAEHSFVPQRYVLVFRKE
jgi:predicted methyltransferase